MARTRTAAAGLAESGHVRVNGDRARAPAKPVRIGDVLTLSLDREPKVLRVLAFAERRGSFDEAVLLYENLTAP